MSSSSRGKPEGDNQPEKPAKPASPGRYSLAAESATESVAVRIDSTRIAAVRLTSDAPPPPGSPSSPPSGAAALAAAQRAPETVRGPGSLPGNSSVSTATQRMEVRAQPPPQQAVATKTARM
ncbi:MAG TPA: hypothetical protein VIF62_38805, partial [Labilithrix sp.]